MKYILNIPLIILMIVLLPMVVLAGIVIGGGQGVNTK